MNLAEEPKYESPLMTVKEVAEYLKVSEKFVYRRLRHEVPVVVIARHVHFEKRVIDAYIENNRENPGK